MECSSLGCVHMDVLAAHDVLAGHYVLTVHEVLGHGGVFPGLSHCDIASWVCFISRYS